MPRGVYVKSESHKKKLAESSRQNWQSGRYPPGTHSKTEAQRRRISVGVKKAHDRGDFDHRKTQVYVEVICPCGKVFRRKWFRGHSYCSNQCNTTFNKKIGHGIRTLYAGIVFRSRTEALAAQVLTASDVDWLYEPKWFQLKSQKYLPDFYLPEFNIWLEVKGYQAAADRKKHVFEEFRRRGEILVVVLDREIRRCL